MDLRMFYVQNVQRFVDQYKRTRKVEAGSNGPHMQQETELRNLSHWVAALCFAFELTNNEEYRSIAVELSEELVSTRFRPYGFSYHARYDKTIDRSNGLIGQAWTIEALAEVYRITKDARFFDVAEKLALQHQFNDRFGLWYSLDLDGKVLNIDNVFNHQLWFCSSICLLNSRSDLLSSRITSFLDNIENNLSLYDDGLIHHLISRVVSSPRARLEGVMKHVRQGTILRRIFSGNRSLSKIKSKDDALLRDIGYHSFNTFAFSILKQFRPNAKFWNTEKFSKLVQYLISEEYEDLIRRSKYSFSYNPPGYEVPVSLERLSSLTRSEILDRSIHWMTLQIESSYDQHAQSMTKGTSDPATQCARIYELGRLSPTLMADIDLSGVVHA